MENTELGTRRNLILLSTLSSATSKLGRKLSNFSKAQISFFKKGKKERKERKRKRKRKENKRKKKKRTERRKEGRKSTFFTYSFLFIQKLKEINEVTHVKVLCKILRLVLY